MSWSISGVDNLSKILAKNFKKCGLYFHIIYKLIPKLVLTKGEKYVQGIV